MGILEAEVAHLRGRVIKKIHAWKFGTFLVLEFNDGEKAIFEVYAECCSSTWIENVEAPTDVNGAVLRDVVQSGEVSSFGNDYDYTRVYNTTFRTDRGDIVVEYRNSSSGYYGGDLNFEGFAVLDNGAEVEKAHSETVIGKALTRYENEVRDLPLPLVSSWVQSALRGYRGYEVMAMAQKDARADGSDSRYLVLFRLAVATSIRVLGAPECPAHIIDLKWHSLSIPEREAFEKDIDAAISKYVSIFN